MLNPDVAAALQCETDFLAGVDANLEAAKGRHFRGTIWQRSQFDESDRLRAVMASNRLFDRELMKSFPANRRITLQGFEKRFLFGKKRTGVAIASVIAPLSHYASKSGGAPPPIGLGELMDHVRKLVVDPSVPHVIGVCSPSGFSAEVEQARVEMPNVTVVLIEQDENGGWRTRGASERVDPRLLRIFDPESANQKLERVRRFAEEHSTEMITGGLSASSAASKLHLPEDLVKRAFEYVATKDPELKVSNKNGEFLLYRGAAAIPAGKKPMGMIDRIRQMFASELDTPQKINLLAERRAALSQRRDRIYEDIGKLEKVEASLLDQGKAATSAVPKRRLAAQLAQLRKDIGRQNTTAAMLNQQINIISTDIHNLTLIQQGEVAQLPDTQELTENAVRAEELLESLRADADLVSSLETGMEATISNEEELAILQEFDEGREKPKTASANPMAPGRAEAKREVAPPVFDPPSSGASKSGRKADPEAT